MAEEEIKDQTQEEVTEPVVESQIKEEDFLKYASEHLGKEVKSFDEIVRTEVVEKEVEKEIQTVPDYLKAYDEFYKETGGRPISDFVRATKDWSQEKDDEKVSEYLRRTKPHYDSDDIAYKLEELKSKMNPSEDDDEDDVNVRRRLKGAQLEWKDLVRESESYLQSETEKFKTKIPDVQTQVDEGKEIFKQAFSEAVEKTESLKFGDLDYKFSKDDLKGIDSLEDITAKVLGENGGDMEQTLKSLLFAMKGEQIIKDAVETAIVNHENERLKQKNNAQDAGLPHTQKQDGGLSDALRVLTGR